MKPFSPRIRITALMAMVLCCQSYAWSSEQHKRPSGQPPLPPQEAFEACANLIAKDPCTITLPDSNVLDGTCELAKNAEQVEALACRPTHMPPPPDHDADESDDDSEEVE